jgi:tetratricopeptide (TPR) repeat protein
MRAAATLVPASLGAATALAALVYDPQATAAAPKRVFASLLAVVLLSLAAFRASPPKRKVAAPAMLFLGFVAWSALTWSRGVPSGARDLASWTAAAGLVVATLHWPSVRVQKAATWAAILIGTSAGAWAVVEALGGARGIFLHGGQGNANWLGLLVACTLPPSLAALRGRGRTRLVVSAALALEAAGIVLAHSRVAWGASACALIFFVATTRSRPRLTVPAVALVALLGATAIVASRPSAPARDPASLAGGDVPIPLAWQGRTWIWRASADAASGAMPFGAGLGGFAHAFLEAQAARLQQLPPREASRAFVNATTAHSDWLEVLVDSGPLALLLLVLAVGAGVAGARRRWPEGAASLVAFAVCAAGDSPLRQPAISLVVGLTLAATPRAWSLGAARSSGVSMARWGTLAASAWMLVAAGRTWIAERCVSAARDLLPVERRSALARATRIDPSSGEIALELGLAELDVGDAQAAVRDLSRSRALLANVGTFVALGNAWMLLEDPQAALAAYERALWLYPGSFRAHANVSRSLVALGRVDEAKGQVEVARELWPGHPAVLAMAEEVERARLLREAPMAGDGEP